MGFGKPLKAPDPTLKGKYHLGWSLRGALGAITLTEGNKYYRELRSWMRQLVRIILLRPIAVVS